MLKRLCLLTLCIVLIVQAYEVRQLDSKQFKREVLESDRLWLVASSDVSESVLKELNNVASATLGVFNIAQSVDKANTGSVLRFYGENKEEPIEYTENVQTETIIDFLFTQTQNVLDNRAKEAKQAKQREEQQYLENERAKQEAEEEAKIREKSNTIIVTKQKFNQLFQSRQPFLLNAYSSKCTECRSLNKQWEKVTDQLRDRIKIAKVNLTEHDDLEDTLKVTTFPTILYFPAGIKNVDKAERYDGFKRSKSIIDWALKEYNKPVESSIDHLTSQLYTTICKNAKGTCVIFFVENESSPQLQQLSSLPKSYTGKPITFFYLVKGEQAKLAEQFGVTSYPNTLMIYTTRKTSWVLNHLEVSKVQQAVGQVMLGNRNNFSKFKFDQILQ